MSSTDQCGTCSGNNVVEGTLNATGHIHFRPDDAKFFKLQTANVDLKAYLCLDCGTVGLKADVAKVKALTDKG